MCEKERGSERAIARARVCVSKSVEYEIGLWSAISNVTILFAFLSLFDQLITECKPKIAQITNQNR